MRHRVIASALLAIVAAACGGDGKVTEPTAATNLKPVAAIGTDAATGATIETNLNDYAPGGAVNLTGRGWAPNETVHLVMTEDPDRHADVVRDVQTDGSGGFALHFYDVQENDLGVRFTLTGTGAVSGSVVSVQFTDQRNISAVVLTPASPFAPGTSVSANVQVLLNTGGGGPSTWLGTKWEIRNSSNVVVATSPLPCINTPNHSANDSDEQPGNKHTESFTFTAGGAGTYSLTVSVYSTDNCADPADATSLTVPFTVAASNAAPVVSAGADATVNEGATFTQNGSFTDPDANSWTAKVNYGDGSADQSLSLTLPAKTFSLSHVYADNGVYTVTVTVNDGTVDGSDGVQVTVNNVPPTATFNAPTSVSGGSPIEISLTNPFDPSTVDVTAGFTYAFDCGDGAGYNAFSATTTRSCPTSGTGSRTVKGKIKDKDNEETEYSASVAINNVPPTATAGASYSGNEGSAIGISGSGSDPDGGTVTYLWSVAPNDGVCTFGDATSASTTVTCKDNGSWNLTVTVTDDENVSTPSAAAGLTVANVKPTATFNAPSSVNEGSPINVSLTSPVEPSTVDQASLQYSFDCGTGAGYVVVAGSSVACPTTDNGSRTVKGKIADKDGGFTEYTASVTINNVDPTATFLAPTSINEGSNIALSLTNPVDPSSADVEAGFKHFFDCGLGAGYVASANNSASCPTTDNGSRTLKGRIEDKDGGATEYTASVTINNVAPTATLNSPASVNEGSSIALSLTGASDVSPVDLAAGFTYAFDCGTGTGYGAFGPSNNASCTTSDNGSRTVKGKVRDKDLGEREYTASVAVANVDPLLGLITIAPGALVPVNTTITASAQFTDVGTGDVHTGTYNWDDGTTPSATVSETNGSGSVSGTHKYTAAGVYLVTLTLNDDDGGTASAEYQYVVVYDPNAGFVTGGGWIMSEAGACRLTSACGAATGKANFGFVSKYKKGATVPEGDTEFQFHAGNLNFKSKAYEWLVVSGARAQFKGTGTINGAGDYGFLLTSTDGNLPGGGGADKFRIKIVDKATGAVVYDNQASSTDDDLTAGTAISGGSIVIHSK